MGEKVKKKKEQMYNNYKRKLVNGVFYNIMDTIESSKILLLKNEKKKNNKVCILLYNYYAKTTDKASQLLVQTESLAHDTGASTNKF